MTESSTTSLQISELEAGIALMTLDMPGSGANILTQNLFAELGQAMEQLAEREDLDGLILFSAKPTISLPERI
jgi:enoyl-CoA hydratase/carnithine racemase